MGTNRDTATNQNANGTVKKTHIPLHYSSLPIYSQTNATLWHDPKSDNTRYPQNSFT
jgi:hypothetical protein